MRSVAINLQAGVASLLWWSSSWGGLRPPCPRTSHPIQLYGVLLVTFSWQGVRLPWSGWHLKLCNAGRYPGTARTQLDLWLRGRLWSCRLLLLPHGANRPAVSTLAFGPLRPHGENSARSHAWWLLSSGLQEMLPLGPCGQGGLQEINFNLCCHQPTGKCNLLVIVVRGGS